jgi:hypothetical protein
MKNILYSIIIITLILNLTWCQSNKTENLIEEENNKGITLTEQLNIENNEEEIKNTTSTWNIETVSIANIWKENNKKSIKKIEEQPKEINTNSDNNPVAQKYCNDNKWKINENNICDFWENKKCSLTELTNWTCKWIDYSEWTAVYIEENNINNNQIAEQYCKDSYGKVLKNNKWNSICIFLNSKTCELSEISNWDCKWIKYEEWTVVQSLKAEDACIDVYEPVCWNDWKLYSNKCFLEKAWIQEGKENIKLIDDECVEI